MKLKIMNTYLQIGFGLLGILITKISFNLTVWAIDGRNTLGNCLFLLLGFMFVVIGLCVFFNSVVNLVRKYEDM